MHRHDTLPTSDTDPNGGLMALDVVFLVNKAYEKRGCQIYRFGSFPPYAGGVSYI